jgi:hypothetical protein
MLIQCLNKNIINIAHVVKIEGRSSAAKGDKWELVAILADTSGYPRKDGMPAEDIIMTGNQGAIDKAIEGIIMAATSGMAAVDLAKYR